MTKDEAETSGVCEDGLFRFRADIDKSNLAPSTEVSWLKLAQIFGLGDQTYRRGQ
jgi:hypothetical protein